MVSYTQGAGPLRPRWSTPTVVYAMRCQLAAACLLLASSAAPTDLTLDGVVYVSRHGVRAPYGPIVDAAGTAAANDDWSAWTSKA